MKIELILIGNNKDAEIAKIERSNRTSTNFLPKKNALKYFKIISKIQKLNFLTKKSSNKNRRNVTSYFLKKNSRLKTKPNSLTKFEVILKLKNKIQNNIKFIEKAIN